MPYNVYDENGTKILQDQPSTFTINNLTPLKSYSNYKIEDTQTGKTLVMRPFSTSAKPATGVSVQFNNVSLDLNNNKTSQINVTPVPADTTDTTNFTTSNSSIATVSGTGLITAVGVGTTDITVLVGAQSTTVTVSVS
ncbi:MAG: hypothetical protein [Caudoviricetes sp.]|nr:MAG: hypothetical protein [Caudoviricetes sp.]